MKLLNLNDNFVSINENSKIRKPVKQIFRFDFEVCFSPFKLFLLSLWMYMYIITLQSILEMWNASVLYTKSKVRLKKYNVLVKYNIQ